MTEEERTQLIVDIAAAIRMRSTDKQLTDDESRWVRLAIQKEAQSIVFRKAVIEKTLSALVWSFIVGLGFLLLDGLKAHGWK
jgi:hypothetical protein